MARSLLWCAVVNKETTMTTKFERLFFGAAVATGLAAILCAGCGATGLAERPHTADVRLSIPMRADSPRLVVVGPARLLHVDVQGHGVVSLYAVRAETGLERDCDSAPLPKAMTLIPDETNRLDLDVPAGQAICMTTVKRDDRRLGEVHLHARRFPGAPSAPTGTLQARN
jgi:hypothetical protein